MAMNIQAVVLRNMTPCSLVGYYQSYRKKEHSVIFLFFTLKVAFEKRVPSHFLLLKPSLFQLSQVRLCPYEPETLLRPPLRVRLATVAATINEENRKTLPYWTKLLSEESEDFSAKFYAR